jgi:tRNA pseudouridine55 synthase
MAIDGVLLVDKPAGVTSAEVVRRLCNRLGRPRVGHLGTLDPFATGLLPIMIGEATKLASLLHHGDKRYEGLIRLGVETDTLDPTGTVARTAPVPSIDSDELARVASRFTGVVEQVPPVFSALKRGGVRLYELARRGADVEPPAPRRVTIGRLELSLAAGDMLSFVVACSTGTYVRSLARDVGLALGTVGSLEALRRTSCGTFAIDAATPLDDLIAAIERGAALDLIGLREAIPWIAECEVGERDAARLRNGDARALDGLVPPGAGIFKVIADGRLVAIAEPVSRVNATLIRVFVGQGTNVGAQD